MGRRLVVVGDTHVGSVCALWPDGFKTPNGNRISLNKAQIELWGAWNSFVRHPLVRSSDTVVLMGDLVQGNNRRRWGAGTVTSNLSTQVAAAIELLRPLCEGKTVVGVIGTGYHDSLDMHLDALIIQELGGRCLGELTNIRVVGTKHILNVAHGVGGGALYSGTIADREGLMADLGAAREKIAKISLLVRGHLHHYWFHEDCSIGVLQVPCWQCWYPFKAFIRTYGKRQPDIGGVVIDVGERVSVTPILFPTPKLYDEVVDI